MIIGLWYRNDMIICECLPFRFGGLWKKTFHETIRAIVSSDTKKMEGRKNVILACLFREKRFIFYFLRGGTSNTKTNINEYRTINDSCCKLGNSSRQRKTEAQMPLRQLIRSWKQKEGVSFEGSKTENYLQGPPTSHRARISSATVNTPYNRFEHKN